MRAKYPRTPHVPWSPGASDDDVRTAGLPALEGREVVVTEKLDGENTTLYRDGLHARSLDSAHHPSRAWIKGLHARIQHTLPDGWRVCGENLFAQHSIRYDALDSYFVAFSVWDGQRALPWDDTMRFAHARGLPTPRVLWRGTFDARALRKLKVDRDRQEGWVVRTTDGFAYADFDRHVAKWVRPAHVQTDTHWMHAAVVPNGLGPQAALWEVRSGGPIDDAALGALVGGQHREVQLDALGDRRLAAVLAARLAAQPRGELLPALVPVLGQPLARATADLVGLHALLLQPIDDDARVPGLRSLARAVDLLGLHAVSAAVAPTPAPETLQWSRLVAEDEGLLVEDPLRPIREALTDPDPAVQAFRTGEALDRYVSGTLRSPEEAVAATWDLRPTGRLTVLVGPSGSGKSTVAAGLRRPVVELDALRDGGDERQVLARGLERLDALQGDAVWDATGLVRTQRDRPIAVGKRHGCLIELISVLTPREVAEQRNRARARRVPDDVVERQWRRVDWPYPNQAHLVRDEVDDAHQ